MEGILTTLGIAAAAWLGFKLVVHLVVLVQLLRLPMWETRMRARPVADVLAALPPDQRALVEELASFGFTPVVAAMQQFGPRECPAVFLRHADGRSYAGVTLLPSAMLGYPVAFYSVDAAGKLLITTNRLAWFSTTMHHGVELADPYADSLIGHWQAHRAREAGCVELDVDTARQRVWTQLEGTLARMQAAGTLKVRGEVGHLTIAAALGCLRRWMRVKKQLARPYTSAATSREHVRDYFIACAEAMEAEEAARPPHTQLKSTVLVLSMAASLLLWGIAFDWRTAVALIVILFIHESGHALVMRAFGWKDMSMFFIPFVGAIVTGKPKEMAAWKQALALFAGPLPGLLAGVAYIAWAGVGGFLTAEGGFSWVTVAFMAVAVNLFNLLPFTPLDGGRLVELALFARWPALRAGFAVASAVAFVGVAWWLDSRPMIVIGVFLLFGLGHQFRLARLQAAVREGVPANEQWGALYDALLRREKKPMALTRALALVRGALAVAHVRRARAWESAAVMLTLALIWGVAGAGMWYAYVANPPRASDARTPAQAQFDNALSDYLDLPGPETLAQLDAARPALKSGDPRETDYRAAQAFALTGDARERAIEALLGDPREGLTYNHAYVLQSEVIARMGAAQTLPPQARAERIEADLAWAARVYPSPGPLIEPARLALAEALDQSGDRARAEALLTQLHSEVAACKHCYAFAIIEARTWFHLSHGEAAQALAVLDAPREPVPGIHDPFAVLRAWALLEAGRGPEAVTLLRTQTFPRGPLAGQPVFPLDLAHALHASGAQPGLSEAERTAVNRQCAAYRDEASVRMLLDDNWAPPWQRNHKQQLVETVRRECGGTPQAAPPG